MHILLKILPFIFILPGAAVVYTARWLVKRYKLDGKVNCDFESDMTEEEVRNYKLDKAIVTIKMLGILITLPGIALVFIIFR